MYFYSDGENEVGPFTFERLHALRESDLLADGTLVREAGSSSWILLGDLLSRNRDKPKRSQKKLSSLHSEASEHMQSRQIEKEKQSEDSSRPGTGSPKETVETDPGAQQERRGKGDPAYKYVPQNKKVPAPAETGFRSESEEQSSVHHSSSGWLSHPPTPWRRYGARLFDTTFNGFLGFFLLGLVFYAIAPYSADQFFSVFEGEAAVFLDLILTGIIASLIGGSLIGVSGLTLGKLIFGVKVTKRDESKLGLVAGVQRDIIVFVKGLGFCIPIVSLITMWIAYGSLRDNETTSWDESKYIVWHRPSSALQTTLNVLGVIAIVLVGALIRVVAEL